MERSEVYYKFIFPNYNKLSGYNKSNNFGTDENPVQLTSDGDDQEGEVLTLCRKCPERVITYDQLKETNVNNLIPMYKTAWETNRPSSQPYSRDFIKQCVDYWKNLPKYFSLRNYWDHDPPQTGGMSLIISHSPEVGLTSTGWTKFDSSDIPNYNGERKIIYCSLMISSGDFYYSFTLPEEAISKANLRDKIVHDHFHSSWYMTATWKHFVFKVTAALKKAYETDPSTYPLGAGIKEELKSGKGKSVAGNSERRVFTQSSFDYPAHQFGLQSGTYGYAYWEDRTGNIYTVSEICYKETASSTAIAYDPNEPIIPDISSAIYKTISNTHLVTDLGDRTLQIIPADNSRGYFKKISTGTTTFDADTNTPLIRYKISYSTNDAKKHGAPEQTTATFTLDGSTKTRSVTRVFAIEEASHLAEDLKHDFIDLEVTRRILYYDDTHNSSTKLKYTKNNTTSYIDITPIKDIPKIINAIPDTGPTNDSANIVGYIAWTSTNPNNPNITYSIEHAKVVLNLLKDAGIGFNYSSTDGQPSVGYSSINTKISYEPPDEYKPDTGCPPLQIPYNLLRYCLNDRPPFTDCETVLVMWIATPYEDNNHNIITPDNISTGDIASLHKLNWQQYAIPISMRCCFKDTTKKDTCTSNQDNGPHKHIHNRFFISYPFYQSVPYTYASDGNTNMLKYQFYIRANEAYNKNKLDREALFVKDLIDYSQDYIVSFHKTDYKDGSTSSNNSSFFDIQKFLFKKLGKTNCASLYVRKKYYNVSSAYAALSYRRFAAQVSYLYIPNNLYNINTNKIDYITDPSDNTGNTAFDPQIAKVDPSNNNSSYYFSGSKFHNWNPAYENFWEPINGISICAVHNNYFVAIFNKTSNIDTITGSISLVNATNLRTCLQNRASGYTWEDLYISTFGISPYNIYESQCYLFNSNSDPKCHVFPLGLLNNYIKITYTNNDTETFGTSYERVIVGFKQMYDYDYSDMYHFKYKYDSYTNTYIYKPVRAIYNFNASSTGNAIFDESPLSAPIITAYVMNYS